MESGNRKLQANPRASASWFSILFFGWTIPMFKRTYNRILRVCDINEPLTVDQSRVLGDRLERNWQNECKKKTKPLLIVAVAKTFWPEFFFTGIIFLFSDVISPLVLPYLLEKMLSYFRDGSEMSQQDALKYGSAICFMAIVPGIAQTHQFYMGNYYGMRIRVAVCSLIYRKALRLSQISLCETAPGKLVNLLSNDVSRFELASMFLNYMWASPLFTILATYILWMETRWAGMFGLLVIFFICPIQSYSGKLSASIRFKTALRSDERVRFMDEIISGVQVIKMYVWEKSFAKLITETRRLEMKSILNSGYVRALHLTFNLFANRLALFCTVLSTMILYGHESITVSKIFMISSLFQAISFAMCRTFVRGIAELGEVYVSTKRLQMFLEYKEKNPSNENSNGNIVSDQINSQDTVILMKNVSTAWNNEADRNNSNRPVKRSNKVGTYKNNPNGHGTMNGTSEHQIFKLQQINLEVPKGKLVFVIGSVGAGKSTLMQVLLKELPILSGSMKMNGTISYACQENWIFASTVRQNILFGQQMDQSRYDAVIQCCALKTDFIQLSEGDMTVVGENGSGLSGGQKARINLARAVYRKADIYLIDDPLSAVDTHVQSHLFNNCLGPNGFLANQNATRILITHQVHFLKEADWIVVLKNGTIDTQGKYNDIVKSGIDIASMLNQNEENDEDEIGNIENDVNTKIKSKDTLNKMTHSTISITKQNSMSVEKQNNYEEEKTLLKELEESSKGKIKGSLLMQYLKAAERPFTFVFLAVSFLLSQILASLADIWVAFWVQHEEHRALEMNATIPIKLIDSPNAFNQTINAQEFTSGWSSETYEYIYGAIMGSLVVITLLRSLWFFRFCAAISQNLHDAMFRGLISAKMRFFDTNPSGRILNRFSKDMGSTDEALCISLLDAIQFNLITFGTIVVTIYTNPIFAILIIILGLVFWCIRNIFLKCSTNLKRMEGMTKSPVFSHISATLKGLSTVRAFQAENLLQQEFDGHQDLNTGTSFMFLSTTTGFGMSLDLMVYGFIACVIYSFILIKTGATGDRVGLAITQSLSLIGSLQWAVKRRKCADVTNNLTSVERILEYCQLEPEKQPQKPQELADNWPSTGKIEFKNVFYRYAEAHEPVLRGLSFSVKPNEKISVVGRTGAGKSSLISSIFRLASVDGDIFIDDVNTSNVELSKLRSKISIIPQEPTLFSGTLRRNLDPFNNYNDDEIWCALENVGLKELVSRDDGLQMLVSANGQNFSTGQRQMFCLARAILRKTRIIVLDEATANVDLRTDEMIQRTIREKFVDSTVITVAHRLHTVIDSDRVLVLDAGIAIEFEQPYVLLQNKDSIFRKMVEALGSQEYERLYAIAKDKFINSKNV